MKVQRRPKAASRFACRRTPGRKRASTVNRQSRLFYNLPLDFQYLSPEISPMVLPYKVATLLYCFNERDEVLLLERSQEPNRGFWSPCGGKLKMEIGESPYTCAIREAQEEICVTLAASDLHLAGMVSEHGYQGQTHWLMFLFEVRKKLSKLPDACHEGRFQFFPRDAIESIKIPQTDREQIWPWFWKFRGGFFAAHCHCHPDGRNDWMLEEARA
ncbi:MAG TPA: NUDIX domain-containing protein [Verrucomicrobiae bacterium]|nr:NUDIX domain-containing protein [Verrucomicrobiae bacterium]